MRMTLATVAVAAVVAGCTTPRPVVTQPPATPAPTPAPTQPPDPFSIPDPVPRAEPRSRSGNPRFYEVFGKRYFVLESAAGFRERGIASWYGPGFHAAKTASGERYDMYQMSAAHRTLPLPTYVRVTHLGNGKSVTVRVNDRGPFKSDRVIDLSYTAAAKLGMLQSGTALVEIEALTPASAPSAARQPTMQDEPLFVQAGAFGESANAERLVARLKNDGIGQAFVQRDEVGGRKLYRVRVGPVPDVHEFDRIVAELRTLGIADAQLAVD
jgi:rare lipoprotein A